jgi:hypothetical protein
VAVTSQETVLKQWIPVGVEEDYAEPDLKDTEIPITLESEVMEFL